MRNLCTNTCRHTQTPCMQHRENQTSLQPYCKIFPTFHGQDSSKLDTWFMDIETTADIFTESCTCLAEATSHSLTHMLICKATSTEKCWDEIKVILRLELCNASIHTFTSYFMEIQQKDKEILAAYICCFKTTAKQCMFNNDTVSISILGKGLQDGTIITAKYI